MLKIKNAVGNWQKPPKSGSMNDPNDVKVAQQLLIDVAQKVSESRFRPRGVNGTVSKSPQGSSTVQAITNFQKDMLATSMPDGRLDPDGKTWKGLIALRDSSGFEKLSGLDSQLKSKVFSFIALFGKSVTINSGKRTVTKQAEEMAPMSDSDLNMYGATSAYVVKIKALPKADRTTAKVQEILEDAMKKGSKISDHLQGKAVDISAKGAFDWNQAETIAKKLGLTPKKEISRNCFHMSK